MYELWAKKRIKDGIGHPYEFITNFNNIEEKFYMIDQLDKEIYAECIITNNNKLIFYWEFLNPSIKKTNLHFNK